MRQFFIAFLLILLFRGLISGQSNPQTSPRTVAESSAAVPLAVPVGTPLPVVLDKEVRIQKVGQTVHGKIAEPVYAFDKLVVPPGSEVTGQVTRIGSVSASQRVLAALNANLSPTRDVQVDFDQLVLPDGRHVPLRTHVSPASQGVLQFAPAANMKKGSEEK